MCSPPSGISHSSQGGIAKIMSYVCKSSTNNPSTEIWDNLQVRKCTISHIRAVSVPQWSSMKNFFFFRGSSNTKLSNITKHQVTGSAGIDPQTRGWYWRSFISIQRFLTSISSWEKGGSYTGNHNVSWWRRCSGVIAEVLTYKPHHPPSLNTGGWHNGLRSENWLQWVTTGPLEHRQNVNTC